MKPAVTVNYLQKSFVAYDFDWLWLHERLKLDLAHIQLLRDFQTGWSEPNPRLLLALLFLVDAVNHGSLCLLLNNEKMNDCANRTGLSSIQAHIETLNLDQYQLASQSILVFADNRLYFKKHHQQQTMLQRDLSTLVTHSTTTIFDHDAIKRAIDDVVTGLPYRLESQQIQALLTAVLQPFSIISGGPGTGKTTILLSLLKVLIALGIPANKIALAAPTGRAANRMAESIEYGLTESAGKTHVSDISNEEVAGLSATTIHRLLGSNPMKKRNRFHANNYLPFDLVVVDEVSMVDIELMNHLIQAIGPSTRLVFMGDQFQLPSVQSGALLADLMPPIGHDSLNTADFLAILVELWPTNGQPITPLKTVVDVELLTDKVTVLQVSKRCEPHIALLSEQVRQGNADNFMTEVYKLDGNKPSELSNPNLRPGVFWCDFTIDHQRWFRVCRAWYVQHYLNQSTADKSYVEIVKGLRFKSLSQKQQQVALTALFSSIKSQRILTLTHGGIVGTEQINALMASWMKRDLQIEPLGDCFHGAVIMIKRNDAALDLFNGDVGLVMEIAPNQFQAYFEVGETYQAYSIHLIPDFMLAFSMTVHKSQGSEFNHVLIPLTEQLENPLLTREIIYTGMTRAKQSVLIVGSEATLKRAISHQTIRYSGLTFWYNQKN